MIIPLNLKDDRSVALHVMRTEGGFSVLPGHATNGFGLQEIESYQLLDPEIPDEFDPLMMFDYHGPQWPVVAPDLYEAIELALVQLGFDNSAVKR